MTSTRRVDRLGESIDWGLPAQPYRAPFDLAGGHLAFQFAEEAGKPGFLGL